MLVVRKTTRAHVGAARENRLIVVNGALIEFHWPLVGTWLQSFIALWIDMDLVGQSVRAGVVHVVRATNTDHSTNRTHTSYLFVSHSHFYLFIDSELVFIAAG